MIFHILILWFFNFTLILNPEPESQSEILINFEFPEEEPRQEELQNSQNEEETYESRGNQAKNLASDYEERKVNPQEFEQKAEQELQEEINKLINEAKQESDNKTDNTSEALPADIPEENIEDKYKDVLPEANKPSEFKGKTNITYSLENRYDLKLKVPVYMCENSGKVTVNIVVNRSGHVVSASVNENQSTVKDYCLYEAAKNAALHTKFNTSYDAPLMQKGFIEYHFMPQ
ncbi:MAG: hypothetical protein D6707_03185 [Bacteroidetes bacterium]|nr:MAG: hypothetical protein D6707_03185 [Bacteroidota bacterium]